jgi:hypothetical protein
MIRARSRIAPGPPAERRRGSLAAKALDGGLGAIKEIFDRTHDTSAAGRPGRIHDARERT